MEMVPYGLTFQILEPSIIKYLKRSFPQYMGRGSGVRVTSFSIVLKLIMKRHKTIEAYCGAKIKICTITQGSHRNTIGCGTWGFE
jgi:hypothetical protein